VTARLVRAGDLTTTFVFAIEGALAAIAAGFDPVGVLALSFVTALGGGVMRDMLIGASPPAAVTDQAYCLLVLAASGSVWALHPLIGRAFPATVPGPMSVPMLMTTLDAAGLGLGTVVGTEKALNRGIARLPAIFFGAVGGVGGGVARDVLTNQVPRVLYLDIYATAALLGAAIVVAGGLLRLPPRLTALIAGVACFGLRMAAVRYGWQLPRAV
jgi:uncharacterized membrane protein YeiH